MRVHSLLTLILFGAAGCHESEPPLTCPNCAIQLEKVVTLSSEGGPGALSSWPSSISRDSKSCYYVTTPWAGEEAPFVYDSTGRFERRLGSVGNGPGEYRYPEVVLVTRGDTIWVFDPGHGRLTILSPTFAVVRTVTPVPHISHATELSDGQLAVNNASYPGLPLSKLDRQGVVTRSFGAESDSVFRRDEYIRIRRALASSRNGGLWSAREFFSYQITLWDSAGTVIRSLNPKGNWFEPYERAQGASPHSPPTPHITDLFEDERGRLWILGRAADPNWTEGLGELTRREGQDVYPIEDPERVYDGIIEVIDPEDGGIIASRRLDEAHYMLAVQPGLIASASESEAGWILIDVFRVGLRQ